MPPVDQPADRPRVAGTASEDEASGFRDPSWQTAPIFPLDRGRRPSLDSIAADPLCDLVGIEAPVVLAPIGCAVTPLLAEGVEDGSKPESSEGATREKGLAAWLLRWECLRSFPARPARPRQRARSTPSTCGWSFGRSSARSWQGAKSL